VSSWMKEHWSNSRKVPNHIPTQVDSIICLWNISILLLESYHVVSEPGLFLFVFWVVCRLFNSRTFYSCCFLSVLGYFWVFLLFSFWYYIVFVSFWFVNPFKVLSSHVSSNNVINSLWSFCCNFCFLILCGTVLCVCFLIFWSIFFLVLSSYLCIRPIQVLKHHFYYVFVSS